MVDPEAVRRRNMALEYARQVRKPAPPQQVAGGGPPREGSRRGGGRRVRRASSVAVATQDQQAKPVKHRRREGDVLSGTPELKRCDQLPTVSSHGDKRVNIELAKIEELQRRHLREKQTLSKIHSMC
ncbi:PREDICTED: uncharacterized protein LOC106810391 isoform X1 [Priapulus caudatus]|uniref:Uncharacterized protein LOC106810391 isoform X1 n=1 Tax=Priapulus caudatus TaxID=37621 RepID=A0ABM1EAN4_PRICU|nr:PREDICTED: uncharacterized protein LOC106810391 isoform X1 [Priapulus caudatus]